jgi:hypothetical protein
LQRNRELGDEPMEEDSREYKESQQQINTMKTSQPPGGSRYKYEESSAKVEPVELKKRSRLEYEDQQAPQQHKNEKVQ